MTGPLEYPHPTRGLLNCNGLSLLPKVNGENGKSYSMSICVPNLCQFPYYPLYTMRKQVQRQFHSFPFLVQFLVEMRTNVHSPPLWG